MNFILAPAKDEQQTEFQKQTLLLKNAVSLCRSLLKEEQRFEAGFFEAVRSLINKMKEKNIAIELLKKLLAERVSLYKRTNLVQAEKFSDMLNMSLSNYLKGLITNEEVIKELLDMAKQIASAENAADELGLNKEEKAFYDALTKPRAVKDVYTNGELVAITKELTEALRKNRTIDWHRTACFSIKYVLSLVFRLANW